MSGPIHAHRRPVLWPAHATPLSLEPHAMPSAPPATPDEFLSRLINLVARIAAAGDLTAVGPLLEMTATGSQSSPLMSLAESFAHMLVKREAREYPAHAATVNILIECADAALYLAKHARRNVYRVTQCAGEPEEQPGLAAAP